MQHYHPIKLPGPWELGYSLDIYTKSSKLLSPVQRGFNEFETSYSSIGEVLHHLKYRRENDQASIEYLATQAALFLQSYGLRFDVIVPVPCTKSKYYPPVTLVARNIGLKMNKPIVECIEIMNNRIQAKDKDTKQERLKLRKSQFCITSNDKIAGRRLLLVDDLFDTGATLECLDNLLRIDGFAAEIRVMALAKTRGKAVLPAENVT